MDARIRWLVLILACALVLAVAPAGIAQGGLTVRANSHTVRFAQAVSFHLEAEAPSSVEGLDLLFQLDGELAVNRVVVPAGPARQINADWSWSIEPGEMPPGRGITYWWRVHLANGQALLTDKLSFRYDDPRFSWSKDQSGRITIHWYGGDDSGARDLLAAAQAALKRLQDTVGVALGSDVSVYLYQSKSDMRSAIPSRSQGFDESTVTLGMAMGGDTLVVLRTASDARRTVAHEMSHLVVGQATRNPYGGLPVWLDEGLAMYAEGSLADVNSQPLREAISRNTLFSLRSLSSYTGDPSKVDLWYGEVYSVADFLVRKYGREKISQFLSAFKAGESEPQALSGVYGLALEQLEAAWRADIGAPPPPTPAPYTPEARPRRSGSSTTRVTCGAPATLLVLAALVIRRRFSVL